MSRVNSGVSRALMVGSPLPYSRRSPPSVMSSTRTSKRSSVSVGNAFSIRPATRNETASEPISRWRRSARLAGCGPVLNTGSRMVMPSLGPGMPLRWTSWKAADMTGRSASREKRAAARLAGCVVMSRPSRARLPGKGATSPVMERSEPVSSSRLRSAKAIACRLGNCSRGRRLAYIASNSVAVTLSDARNSACTERTSRPQVSSLAATASKLRSARRSRRTCSARTRA